jgi:hypothetical protein
MENENEKEEGEKKIADKLTFVWWSAKWAEIDRMRRRRGKLIPAWDIRGWINKTLEKSVEARFLYVKNDLILRIKSFILQDNKPEDLRRLGKRIGKIRIEFGDAQGRELIVKAVRSAEIELFNNGITRNDITRKLEKLVKKTRQPLVF